MKPDFVELLKLRLWICKTNPRKRGHHGLHTNTAPFVVTADPGKGDTIEHLLYGEATIEWLENKIIGGTAELSLWDDDEAVNIVLLSHPGRSATIGEDGLEDSFDHDLTAQYFIENLRPRQTDWVYAPCTIRKEDSDPRCLNFEYNPQEGWYEVETRDDNPGGEPLEIDLQ